MLTVIIFGHYPLQQIHLKFTPLEFGLFDVFSRIGWSIALSYIIFACAHGSGGLINSFLSHKFFQLFSRICFAVYLVHLPILVLTMGTMKAPPFFNELFCLHTFFGNLVLSILVAIFATLAFEAPINLIGRWIFDSMKAAKKNKINNNNNDESFEEIKNKTD